MFNILSRIKSYFKNKPSPEFIAQQLRMPSGEFAEKVGSKMDVVNEKLFDLTLTLDIDGSRLGLEPCCISAVKWDTTILKTLT